MADPIIKLGSTGSAVKKAQRALICRGYLYEGDDDGIFGPITRRRVLNYQLDRADDQYWGFSFPLGVDGIVGAQSWSRLDPAKIKNGAKGNGVRLLQEILKGFEYPPFDPGPIDGRFGEGTEDAVKAMQAEYNLSVDGVVGPKTWCNLWS